MDRSFDMCRVLVTGATGFIGRHLVEKLSKLGINWLGLSNSSESDKIVRCSLLDKDRLNNLCLEFSPTTVIHLAAIANPTYGDFTQLYQVNVLGTENLLDAVCNTKNSLTPRFIIASTAGVYGNQPFYKIPESAPYLPVNHYSYSKVITELLSQQYKDRADICVCRLFNVVGIGQAPFFLVPKLVNAFVSKQKKIQLGNITAVRDFVDVGFVIDFFIKLMQEDSFPFDVVNVCSGSGYSGQDVYEKLVALTGYRPEIVISDSFVRKNEIRRLVGSTQRISTFFPSVPRGLDLILSDMLLRSTH